MGKVKYILSCICQMDYVSFFTTISIIHKESGKNKLWIFWDMLKCGFQYGTGFNDYLLCEFYLLTKEQRAAYVTRFSNNDLVLLLNDKKYYHIFDNKDEFYRIFGDFLGRSWVDFSAITLEQFSKFMENREAIMVKPNSESGGKGVEKLFKKDFSNLSQFYNLLKEKHIGVIEDVVVQHEKMASLNPASLNTLRIVTILNKTGPHIVYAFVRAGNSDRPVDNLHSGGMFAPIELETGKIPYPAYDKNRNTYFAHPRTKIQFLGFQIPFWEESVAMCLNAAVRVP